MTNRYPGPCANCRNPVPVGSGIAEKDGSAWVVKHTTCPNKPAIVLPEGFNMPYTMSGFTSQVDAMTEPAELNKVRQILTGFIKRNDKHPLRDTTYGFARLYKALNKRIELLGFYQTSDGMCYRHKEVVKLETKPVLMLNMEYTEFEIID